MSTGYGWEGIRQVCAMLLGARHVPERLWWGLPAKGRYNKCSTFTFTFNALASIGYMYIKTHQNGTNKSKIDSKEFNCRS